MCGFKHLGSIDEAERHIRAARRLDRCGGLFGGVERCPPESFGDAEPLLVDVDGEHR